MTKQEIYTTVVQHLRKQGEKSGETSPTCRYRLEKNGRVLQCAIGCLIPDEYYDPEMEDSKIWATSAGRKFLEEVLGVSPQDAIVEFLGELQTIHDNFYVEEWEESFLDLAESHSLNPVSA